MNAMTPAGVPSASSPDSPASNPYDKPRTPQLPDGVDQSPRDGGPQWLKAWSAAEGEAHARELFAEAFGESPDTIRCSQGHMTLLGDHTDYSGGTSLTTIVTHGTYVAARARTDGVIRMVTGQATEVDGPDGVWETHVTELATSTKLGWVRYVAGVLWALAARGYPPAGMDIAIQSCVPIGAGLDSSAAMQCAVALAASDCWGLSFDTPDERALLAEIVLDAEAEYAGVPAGGLGQHTILRCGENESLFLDFATTPPLVQHRPLYHREYGMCLMLVDTRKPHNAGDGQFAQQRRTCELAAAELGVATLREVANDPDWEKRITQLTDPLLRSRARHAITETLRVEEASRYLSSTAPAQEKFEGIGAAMYRSHASLETDFGVSTPALNLAVESARRAGAPGARLMGAGLGGVAVVLLRRDQLQNTAQAIDAEFAAAGLVRPRFFTAKPMDYVSQEVPRKI